jgi:hypothetical protein
MQSDEVLECAGCGGEASIVEVTWLPEPKFRGDTRQPKPFCCRECFEFHENITTPFTC